MLPRTVAYYDGALARIDNRWMGTGEAVRGFQNASHPYSRDLDLFGWVRYSNCSV